MPQSDGVAHLMRNQLGDQRPDKPFRHPVNQHIWLLRGRLASIFLGLDRLPCQFQLQPHCGQVQCLAVGGTAEAIDLTDPPMQSVELVVTNQLSIGLR